MKILKTEEQEKILEQLIILQSNIFKIYDVKTFVDSIECLAEIGGLVLDLDHLERLKDAVTKIKITPFNF